MKKNAAAGKYYGWPSGKNPSADRERPYFDRYEYNEKYLGGYYTSGSSTEHYYTPFPSSVTDKWEDYTAGQTLQYENWSRYGDGTTGIDKVDDSNFAQLYVPYDYFKRACQMIQSVYSADNDYAGYHNFMHYWAMNGAWDWINFTTEGNPNLGSFKQVNYTYLSTNFWNNFDPAKEGQDHAYVNYTGAINW